MSASCRRAIALLLLLTACAGPTQTSDSAAEAALQTAVAATASAVAARQPSPAAARTPVSGTPGPVLTPEEAAYVRGLLPIIAEFNRSYDRFRALVEQPNVEDASWRLALSDELRLWAEGAAAARGVQSPPAYSEVHRRVMNGLELYGQASQQITQALEAGDNELIRQGLENVSQARRAFAEAETELDRIARERGL